MEAEDNHGGGTDAHDNVALVPDAMTGDHGTVLSAPSPMSIDPPHTTPNPSSQNETSSQSPGPSAAHPQSPDSSEVSSTSGQSGLVPLTTSG